MTTARPLRPRSASVEKGPESPRLILGEQFTEAMVIVLIVAAVISVFIGDFKDAIAILAIVVLMPSWVSPRIPRRKGDGCAEADGRPHVKVRRDGRVLEPGRRASPR